MKVAALNKAGEGDSSSVITCYTVTTPGKPGTPILVSSSSSSITLRWDAAYDDGGSPILKYNLEMDKVEGIGFANVENWQNVFAGDALNYSVTTGLDAKYSYRFRV